MPNPCIQSLQSKRMLLNPNTYSVKMGIDKHQAQQPRAQLVSYKDPLHLVFVSIHEVVNEPQRYNSGLCTIHL